MSAVLSEVRGKVQWITLNRPDKRNAINAEVIAGIAEGFERAQSNPEVRAIVLTGAGDKAFCAGGDLKPGAAFEFDVAEPTAPYANLFRLVRNCPLPSIARINGACMAGGMGLLCMTDIAVAAEHVQFGLPEARIGLFPFQVLRKNRSGRACCVNMRSPVGPSARRKPATRVCSITWCRPRNSTPKWKSCSRALSRTRPPRCVAASTHCAQSSRWTSSSPWRSTNHN